MQSGFRLYPLDALDCLDLRECAYSFEIEVLVKGAWAGFSIVEVPVRVLYPPKAERVSHFRTLQDNWRITLLNTRLTIRALIPLPFRHHALDTEGRLSLCSPLRSLKILLQESTPQMLAWSAGIAAFIGTLPLLGLQSILLLASINSLHLNRLCALLFIPLTWLPIFPALSVLLGYYLIHGCLLSEFNWQTLGSEAPQRMLEWMLGAATLAPVMGGLTALLTWCMAASIKSLWRHCR